MSKKVFIGVGHGGNDSGAVAHGLKEKDLNLNIAIACGDVLIRHGVGVLLSRDKDQTDPLSDKINRCNQFSPTLAIDIHNNAGGGDGFEVFHQTNKHEDISKKLAHRLNTQVVNIGQNSRGVKTKLNGYGTDYFGFLRLVNAPAVLVECAFMDTKDIHIIDTTEEQKAMGTAVAKGILDALGIPFVEDMETNKLYRVQVGAFKNKGNAERLRDEIKEAGFEGFVV